MRIGIGPSVLHRFRVLCSDGQSFEVNIGSPSLRDAADEGTRIVRGAADRACERERLVRGERGGEMVAGFRVDYPVVTSVERLCVLYV